MKRDPNRIPVHPGSILREDVLPALGKSKTEIARLLGISRMNLYDILNEKTAISPEMALRLGKLCGNGPVLWLNMQTQHDLWRAKRKLDLEKIPTLGEVGQSTAGPAKRLK